MLFAELLMRDKGITQVDVANRGGISRVAVNRVLRGHEKPWPRYKKAFCDALEWEGDPDDLFVSVTVDRKGR